MKTSKTTLAEYRANSAPWGQTMSGKITVASTDELEATKRPKLIRVRLYPNRRLYSYNHARYILLQDVYRWILDGQQVAVFDQKGRNVTTITLFKAVTERVVSGELQLTLAQVLQLMHEGE